MTSDNVLTTWPTLYKTGSKGAEQQWSIKVIPMLDAQTGAASADIVVEHGQVGGKSQRAVVSIVRGKNVGRKNETTPWQQAVAEADSKYKKQLDKGYSVERGGASMDLKPMLAHKYEDRRSKVTFPAYVQPKLDGVRALAVRKGDTISLLSRQGKEHRGLDHIRDALLKVMADGEIWDGELYVHGMAFQQLVSLVKKPQAGSERVEYHVYDAVLDKPFAQRGDWLDHARHSAPAGDEFRGTVRFVDGHQVLDHAEVEAYHELYVSKGYEGVMLRWGGEGYKSGYRSEHLLKVKAFADGEFEIVDVVPGVGKEADKGTFVCRTEQGTLFNCRPKGRDELRADYLADKGKYVGKKLTVRYFEMTTSEHPVPRFPVGVAVRDYE